MLFIGLDVGTAGCKASLVDEKGEIIGFKYSEYSVETPQEGYVEMDAKLVWKAVQETLAGVAGNDVATISIATFGEAVVMLDENDEVLANSIFYSDIRGTQEIDDILSAIDKDELQAITGLPMTPMYSANKLMWVKKHQPKIYSKAKKMMLYGDFIAYKLTGERMIDYSLASRSMLFDISEKKWSGKAADAMGIDMDMFSKPVISGTTIGQLLPSVANGLGLKSSVIVVAGGHDQPMAALGAGVVKRGQSVDGMGSAECITLALDKKDITQKMYERNYCCEPYVFEDKFVTLAFNTSSGTAIKWYRDAVESERSAEYAKTGKSFYSDVLEKECSRQTSGVYFLPFVAGSGTPYVDNTTGAAFIGIRASTRKPDLYRAVLEGVCFEMKLNIDVLKECGIVLDDSVAVGGGAESQLLMQIKADIWNRQIKTVKTAQAGIMGLCMLSGVAKGAYSSIEEAVSVMVKPGKVYEPNSEMVKIYEEKMLVYKKIFPAVKNMQNT